MLNPFDVLETKIDLLTQEIRAIASVIHASNLNLSYSAPEAINDHLSVAQLCDYLNCSESTVHRYKNNKVIPYYKAGRTVFFKKQEVDEALSSVPKKGRLKV